MTKATRLHKLDTKGVAVVDRGANNKRFCLAKADGSEIEMTFEEMVLEVVKGGEMPLDEKAIEDMGARAGLDPQAIETFKAIMKLRHVYRDNAAFNGLLKTMMTQAPQGQQQQPGAPGMQPMPGQQPGAQGAQPGAPGQGQPMPGQQPGAPQPGQQAQPGAQQPGAPGAGKPPFGAEGGEGGEGEGKKPPFGEGADGGGEGGEGEGKKPPFAAQGEGQDEGGEPPADDDKKKKEKSMDPKKAEELKKAADDAIAKAADLEAKLNAQDTVIKAQETQIKVQGDAVKKMQDDLRLQGWVAKAEKELAHIPSETAESLGKQLFDIDTLNAEMAKKTFEAFKKTAEVVKQSGMFKPSGFRGEAPVSASSAEAEFDKLVAENVSKAAKQGDSAEVAKARAEVAIAKSHPGLYKRYCDEKEMAARRLA